ncbi:hypothetical protein B0H13DRAFT_2037821 [Mycena leptocephala]|nr:hypothetical protein B0H13DRAFT_2037821 [Mycena leptocephala]
MIRLTRGKTKVGKLEVKVTFTSTTLSYIVKSGEYARDLDIAFNNLSSGAANHDAHPNTASGLAEIGESLLYRFEQRGDIEDLTESVSAFEKADKLLLEGHLEEPAILRDLARSLHYRFERLGDFSDVYESDLLFEDVVLLLPEGHPDKPSSLTDLGNSVLRRFVRRGDSNDLTRTVSVFKEAVALLPKGHPARPPSLGRLANTLLRLYDYRGDLGDIQEAVLALREALAFAGRPDRPSTLKLLGDSLLRRFEHIGVLDDLVEAFSTLRAAVNLSPDVDPNNDLGYYLVRHLEKLRDRDDILDAMALLQSSAESFDDPAFRQALGTTIPAISGFLDDRDFATSSTAVGLLTTLVADSGCREALGTVIPTFVHILRCGDNPDLKYKIAVSLTSLRLLLAGHISLIDAELGCKSQDIERDGEPQPHGNDFDLSMGNTTTPSIPRSDQGSGIRRRGAQSKEEDPYHHTPHDQVPSKADADFPKYNLLRNLDSRPVRGGSHPWSIPSSPDAYTIPEGIRDYLKGVRSHLPFGGPSPLPDTTSGHTRPKFLNIGRWPAKIGNYIGAAYAFIIAPPFLHDRAAPWDLPRLDHRLAAFQTWVWAANAALFAASVGLLALTDVLSSPVAQSFDILCGVFGLFGFVYTIFLAFRIGDCRTECSGRLIDRANSMQSAHPFWNVGIMLSLPLTWMAWAVVSLLCFMVTLGVQQAILDLRPSGINDTKVEIDPPAQKSLSILQLSGFTVAIGWSLSYVFMIPREIRKCTDSLSTP